MSDLAGRLRGRIQLTTDGHSSLPERRPGRVRARHRLRHAREALRRGDPDAGAPLQPGRSHRDACRTEIIGDPNPKHITTSYVERQNLTMRMSMRRFTRLTQRLFKEGRKPCALRGAALLALQLRAHSPDAPCDASDGGGRGESPVDGRGDRWLAGTARTAGVGNGTACDLKMTLCRLPGDACARRRALPALPGAADHARAARGLPDGRHARAHPGRHRRRLRERRCSRRCSGAGRRSASTGMALAAVASAARRRRRAGRRRRCPRRRTSASTGSC